jgi:hypothetical protein
VYDTKADEGVSGLRVLESIGKDGEVHLAEIAVSLFVSAAPEERFMMVANDVLIRSQTRKGMRERRNLYMRKGDQIAAILDIDETIIAVDVPTVDAGFERLRSWGILEDVAIDPNIRGCYRRNGVVPTH